VRIRRVEVWRVEMPLETPYAVAYASHDSAGNLFLRLVTDGAPVGLGCASPTPYVTGEDLDAAEAALRDAAAPLLEGEPLGRWRDLLHRLEAAAPAAPAARAAVDTALHDLLAKRAGLPLFELLGGARTRIRTSMTVGILDREETLAEAERHRAAGFRALKLKGGHDPAEDVARVRAVRERVGTEVEIYFDANQGYSASDCAATFPELARLGVAFAEQPTPRDDLDLLREIAARSPLPVMADEAARTLEQAREVCAPGGVALLNLKLMRVGGLQRAGEMDAVAAASGVSTMVGCYDASALAISAGLALALSSPNMRYADLDGHIGLGNDPAAELLRLEDGDLVPSPEPGLGLADLP